MFHAIAMSLALLLTGQIQIQSQTQAEVKAEKASNAKGLLRPTEIRLDFENNTLAEIVSGINARMPGSVALRPERRMRFAGEEPPPAPPPQRFSLQQPKSVTFWESIDRVCRVSQTWPISGNVPGGVHGIFLVPASPDRGFVSNDGAFRVVVSGTYYFSSHQFASFFYFPPGRKEPTHDQMTSHVPDVSVNLAVMCEPRLSMHGIAELVVLEAVDEQDRSLLTAVPWRQSFKNPSGGPRGLPNEEHIGVPLKLLDNPGKLIKRLRGSASVVVSSAREPGSPTTLAEVTFQFKDIPMP
jgi:hypothetical protein